MNTMQKVIAGFLFALPLAALAQNAPANPTATPNLDKRQAHQQERIAEGIKSGELTAKEAGNLEKREAKLETDKQIAKADGKVTRQERAKLQREANHNSRKIYRKKHNRVKAAPAQPAQ